MMLEKECIERGRVFDTYRVTGDINNYTPEQIADKCDYNNWGYSVIRANEHEMIIRITKD